jgi:hypothetical protein
MPLGDFPGLDECISNVGGEIPAADGEALRRHDIGTAHQIDLWACPMESPTAQDKINKAVSVIGVHVSEENRIQSLSPDPELR